jgi:hypothetical protein
MIYVDPRERAHFGLAADTRSLAKPAPVDGKARFVTDCVHSTAEKINKLKLLAKEVSYKTFFQHVSLEQACEVLPGGYGKEFPLKRDQHVGYYRSRWEGKRAYFLVHSSIEYIWVEDP